MFIVTPKDCISTHVYYCTQVKIVLSIMRNILVNTGDNWRSDTGQVLQLITDVDCKNKSINRQQIYQKMIIKYCCIDRQIEDCLKQTNYLQLDIAGARVPRYVLKIPRRFTTTEHLGQENAKCTPNLSRLEWAHCTLNLSLQMVCLFWLSSEHLSQAGFVAPCWCLIAIRPLVMWIKWKRLQWVGCQQIYG